MTTEAAARLMAPYRAVRRISAGEDIPWSGLLVQLISGESRLLVDVSDLEADWAGWTAPVDGHVVAPLDIVRRPDGHDVMLPLCVERVSDFLARRAARRVPLSVGETVTLGVSLLRGFATWHAIGHGTGEWWLTEGGRPMLACAASGPEVPRHTADLLQALADGSPCALALTCAAEAVSRTRVSVHDLRDAEDALFGIATAEPLATSLLGPRSARELSLFGRTDPGGSGAPGTTSFDEGCANWAGTLARHVDADLADAVSRATTGLWRRLRTPRAGSRRPWLLASGVAATVLAVGLLWPTGSDGPATADAAVQDRIDDTAAPSGAVSTADATPTPDPAAAPVDLAATADGLLAARLACDGDEACLSEVIVDPGSVFPPGAIDLTDAERRTTLLDDFGGVAVLRVDPVAGTPDAQLVVIMLREDRWLLRDVHVAKQP